MVALHLQSRLNSAGVECARDDVSTNRAEAILATISAYRCDGVAYVWVCADTVVCQSDVSATTTLDYVCSSTRLPWLSMSVLLG